MAYTEDPTLSALDDAGAALSSALMAATRIKARMGYLASPEDRADIRDTISAIENALAYHRQARRAASPTSSPARRR
jgi:hypothetical protein